MPTEIQPAPLLYLYGPATVITAGLLVFTVYELRRRGRQSTILTFTGLVTGLFLWTISRYLEFLFVGEQLTFFWLGVLYIGYGLCTVCLLLFGLAIAGRDDLLTRTNVGALFVFPAVMIALAFTNQYHELVWTGEFIEQSGWYGNDLLFYDRTFTLLSAVYFLYAVVGAALIGLLILLRVALISPDVHRTQTFAFTVGAGAALGFGVLYSLDLQPFTPSYIDLTPFGLTITGLCFTYATFRHQLLDVQPTARKTIVDTLEDAVVVLDVNDQITDANPAALELFDLEGVPIGSSMDSVLGEYADSLRSADGGDLQIGSRYFTVTTTPVENAAGKTVGSTVVFSEVTQRLERERELERREREISRLNHVYRRIFRHNVRNDLAVIAASAELLQIGADVDPSERAGTILEKTKSLNRTADNARLIGQVVDELDEDVRLDLHAIVEREVQKAESAFPEATIAFDAPVDEAIVRAHEALPYAVENLIENAIVHNDDSPEVTVRLESDHEQCTIEVIDDGPGIADDELAVLDVNEETDLRHSSGAGLWLVTWIIHKSNGEFDYRRADGHSIVLIRLER